MDIVKKDIGGNAEAEVVLYQPDKLLRHVAIERNAKDFGIGTTGIFAEI